MRAAAVLLAACALVSACGEDDGTPPQTDVTIKLAHRDPARVRCPQDAAACKVLGDADPTVLRLQDPAQACTQLYGGPETGRVTGTLEGERVDIPLARTDGCEIARYSAWEQVANAAP